MWNNIVITGVRRYMFYTFKQSTDARRARGQIAVNELAQRSGFSHWVLDVNNVFHRNRLQQAKMCSKHKAAQLYPRIHTREFYPTLLS